jgi:hypothetical protein
MTIKDAARHSGVNWDVIKGIQNLKSFARPKLHKLAQIAIDEISLGKGHRSSPIRWFRFSLKN